MNIRGTLRRILDDIRQQKHIDVYVVSGLAIIVAILGLIPNVVSEDARTAIILAALGLLVFNLSLPKSEKARNYDDLLNDRASLNPFSERIKGAKKIWMYAPSAVHSLSPETLLTINNEVLNHPESEFHMIVQDPQEQEAVRILIKQLDEGLSVAMFDVPSSIQQTLTRLEKLNTLSHPGKFEYKFLDYSPGFSIVVVDPDKNNGSVLVEFYGVYNERVANRMHIELTRETSDRWFNYWVGQFEYMWKRAQPPKL